jgi:hypothetical protein
VCGKGTKVVLLPLPPAGPSTKPSATAPAGQFCSTAVARMDRHPNYILAASMASGT